MRAPLVPVLVLALLVPGCLTSIETASAPREVLGLLEPVYATLRLENDKFAAADGVRLDSWIVRPEVPDGTKVPVLLLASPYNQGLSDQPERLLDSPFVKDYASKGYAVVYHSVRGTGDSEGCFGLGGATEQQDLHDVVEHFGAADWSNGNVALFGVSYVGTTPWEAAILDPPSLKTIIPVSGINDMYRYMYYEGAGYSIASGSGGGPTFPTYYYPSVDWGIAVFRVSVPSSEVPRHLLDAACDDMVRAVLKGYETQLDGRHDAFWQERDYSARFADVRASVFLVHGLQDWNVKPDNMLRWQEVPGAKKAWLGQWAHNIPWRNTYNPDWSRDDWNATMQRWLDFHLHEIPNGALDDLGVEVQDQLGAWRVEADWPPTRALPLVLHSAADGTLSPTPAAEGTATYLGVPGTRPGPVAVSDPRTGVSGLGAAQAVFVTEPLAEDLRVAGVPEATVTLARDRAGEGQVVVALFDVAPDGSWTELDRGFLNLRQWEGRDTSSEPPVGTPFTVTVPLYPQDLVFQAGHRVAVVFAGAHATYVLPAASVAKYTLTLGGDAGTRISLPVLPEATGGLLPGGAASTGAAGAAWLMTERALADM